jgi:hypothetical protein
MRINTPVALIGLLLLPAAASAQPGPRDKIEIAYVRVGFSSVPVEVNEENSGIGARDSLYKTGAWAPVYVRLTNIGKYDPDPKKDGPATLIVETPDCDDANTAYSVPVPAFDEQEGLAGQTTVLAYARTGTSYGGSFTIKVVANGKELCKPFVFGSRLGQSAAGLPANQGLYVAIGTRLPGTGDIGRVNTDQDLRGGPRKAYVALMPRIGDLPTVWFGYDSADVVILATGDRDFTTALINDRVRSGALADWVRRGGRLIVCTGANADLFNEPSELSDALPMLIGKPRPLPALNMIWKEGGGQVGDALPALTTTGLVPRDKPARGYRVLAEGPAGGGPLIAQGAYGLGRVTLVTFDLDKLPATKWNGLTQMWQQLLIRGGPEIPNSAATHQNTVMYGEPSSGDGMQGAINGELAAFEGVPVISFGWVALFILIYILVVGPLDYLFLKKVVKRLELTWITFPTVVLAVSAAAYFTAYHLKGRDLRINKLDVVDIDPQSGRAYGRTWMTLFSPRIQKYTVGFEPAAGWVGTSGDASVGVSWFGQSRNAQENLFARRYEYAPRAAGLLGVPVQVWTTKGFQGDWSAPLDMAKPPIENRLRHPPGRPDELIGSVTSRLPVALDDVLMIYRGEVASLGPLVPDEQKVVTGPVRVQFSKLKENQSTMKGAERLNLLFHEAWNSGTEPSNGSLRSLDQSWRLTADNRDEVILVGRVPRVLADGKTVTHEDGTVEHRPPAESVNGGPSVPERLWLEKLPQDGGPRPELSGALRQDTVVRIFLPLTPEKKE